MLQFSGTAAKGQSRASVLNNIHMIRWERQGIEQGLDIMEAVLALSQDLQEDVYLASAQEAEVFGHARIIDTGGMKTGRKPLPPALGSFDNRLIP